MSEQSTGTLDLSDLAPIEEQFTNPFDGQEYVLRQASAAVAKRHHNARLKGAFFKDGKVEKSLEGSADVGPLLVSGCVFGRKKDKNGECLDPPVFDRPVSLQTVESWPDPLVERLFARAKEISNIENALNTPEKVEAEIARLRVLLEELRVNGDGDAQLKNSSGAGPNASG
jgi:hypothetical protein